MKAIGVWGPEDTDGTQAKNGGGERGGAVKSFSGKRRLPGGMIKKGDRKRSDVRTAEVKMPRFRGSHGFGTVCAY